MPGGIDGLIVAKKYRGKKFVFKYLVPRGKEEAIWSEKILAKRDLVYYDLLSDKLSMATLDFAALVKKSNVLKQIKAAGITHILSGHAVTSSLENWAKKNRLTLIAPDFKLVQNLENKLWFDQFLTRNNLPAPASQLWRAGQEKIVLKSKLVLQEPNSRGGEGTYFISQPAELKKLFKVKKIKNNQRYLLRQFKSGPAYGITIFIGRDIIALSSLRIQCYGRQNKNSQKEFLGVQWVAGQSLSAKLKRSVNQVFYDLAEKLRQDGYIGYANIDFIAKGSKVYILECNPRFSSSSVQLLMFAENISRINTAQLFLDDLLLKKTSGKFKFFGLPQSSFTGANLYIATKNKQVISAYYPGGIYKLVNNKIKFIDPDISKFNSRAKSFIFYSDTQPGEVLVKGVIIGWVISNFPLYDRSGPLNSYGKMILEHFKY